MVSATEVHRSVVQEFVLPIEQVKRIKKLAERRSISESRIVEEALDFWFGLDDEGLGQDFDREAWSRLSEPSLLRIWDNDADAAYDNLKTCAFAEGNGLS